MKCLRLIKENGFTVNYSILNFLILHYGPKKDINLNLIYNRKIMDVNIRDRGEIVVNLVC